MLMDVKVIFGGSEGALAGIQGVAGVVVSIDGLLLSEASESEGFSTGRMSEGLSTGRMSEDRSTGHMSEKGDDGDGKEREKEMKGMVLQGLPFEGNVRIGKKSL